MPIIDIPHGITPRKAKEIIKEITSLLMKRRESAIGRRSFLATYSKLRQELAETVEYAQFHYEVVVRAGGRCERADCDAVGKHVHHRKFVAYRPDLALTVSNGEYVCEACHSKIHGRRIAA
jgi:hypothetical protein